MGLKKSRDPRENQNRNVRESLLGERSRGGLLKGVIMAGGMGTRLRPLTLNRPKPMIEVLGIPVIEFVKDALVAAGISEVIVTTGYRGESLAQLVESWNHSQLAAWVNEEETAMGTAGSVKLLEGELKETFVVGSGDTLASFDIAALLEEHKNSGAMASMALWQVDDPSEYGVVGLSNEKSGDIDSDLETGWIVKFQEKPKPEEAFSNVINAGLYILEPEVLELIPKGEKFDWSKQVFPQMLELGMPLRGITISGLWFDIGRPSDLLAAQEIVLRGRDQLWSQIPEGSNEGYLSPNSKVEGTCENSVLLDGCTVGENSVVSGSLLMAKAVVRGEVTLRNCIIGRNSIVESGSVLDGCIIGDDMVVPTNSRWTNRRLPDNANQ
jgi:mannose-1-phosphate guanylyltransferase